jgi:hypothetical protein
MQHYPWKRLKQAENVLTNTRKLEVLAHHLATRTSMKLRVNVIQLEDMARNLLFLPVEQVECLSTNHKFITKEVIIRFNDLTSEALMA